MSSDDDDRIEQEVLKAARDLAKRAVVELPQRPHNIDAYVAGTARAKRETHGGQLRDLIAAGMTACEAADQIHAETATELDDVLAKITNKPSVPRVDHTVKTGDAQLQLMLENTGEIRRSACSWQPPSDDARARAKAIIRETRTNLLGYDREELT